MQLGVSAPNSDLFRTSSGAIFPYNIGNIVSITGTNASAGYYYFFYDWEVVLDPCLSEITAVEAIITQTDTISQNISICTGENIIVGNNTYSISGNFTDTLQTASGCDSIINTN